MRLSLIFPCLLILSAMSCKKPMQSNITPHPEDIPPLVLTTSLDDTLPAKSMKALKLEKVTGLKVKYITGHYASYFEYEADRQDVLRVISQAPFSRDAVVADTVCRKVSYVDLALLKENISEAEISNGSSFWNVDLEEFDVYECLKSPVRHLILISKHSRRVLHRIEV